MGIELKTAAHWLQRLAIIVIIGLCKENSPATDHARNGLKGFGFQAAGGGGKLSLFDGVQGSTLKHYAVEHILHLLEWRAQVLAAKNNRGPDTEQKIQELCTQGLTWLQLLPYLAPDKVTLHLQQVQSDSSHANLCSTKVNAVVTLISSRQPGDLILGFPKLVLHKSSR